MTIDYENAMKLRSTGTASYVERDLMLYALGLGLGADPLDKRELDFVYEKRLKPIPSYMVNAGSAGKGKMDLGINMMMVLHGAQKVEMFGVMPRKAELELESRVAGIFDKGQAKGAVVAIETDIRLKGETNPLSRVTTTMFARGDGGFLKPGQTVQGEQAKPHSIPERAPDAVVSYPTRPDQALLYRLSGDYNPLHADPDFAVKAGFQQPILHGLCTYGICVRAVITQMCEYDPERIASVDARFSTPVMPGETIVIELWRDGNEVSFRAKVKERDVVAVNNGCVLLRNLPK